MNYTKDKRIENYEDAVIWENTASSFYNISYYFRVFRNESFYSVRFTNSGIYGMLKTIISNL